MAIDALGNEIVIGKSYGYILKNKWVCKSVHGIAEKTKNGNVTLGSPKSRSLQHNDSKFSEEDRRRSVSAAFLFPVNL
jgi:hypothetical protein